MSAARCAINLCLPWMPFRIDRGLLPVAHAIHSNISRSGPSISTAHARMTSVMIH